MSENTKIEWADHTFNPWVGCTKVGPGCDHCYAEGWAKRSGSVAWGGERRRTAPANWRKPLKWQANAAEFIAQHGRRQRVFCASLADVFDNQVDPAWRLDLFKLIAATPDLDWLLVTKRIGNARPMMDAIARAQPIPGRLADEPVEWQPMDNVWLGITVVNQGEADRDIPKLLAAPARVRFLSMEPLLGPVDIMRADYLTAKLGRYPFRGMPEEHRTKLLHMLDWVIVGGESGPGARPMHPDWARDLRDQCAAAGVPFLFKQWGEWIEPDIDGLPMRLVAREGDPEFFDAAAQMDGFLCVDGRFKASVQLLEDNVPYLGMKRVGKKAAGRLLDGVEHNGFPEVRP
ncbi:MAG: phage Gp37/Gp68 family protein [Aquabacterium sp.]